MFDVEGLKRHEAENPLNLTNVELEERKAAVDAQMAKYPHISSQWIELLWNYLRTCSEEECRQMVNSGELKKKNLEVEQTEPCLAQNSK